MWASTSWLLHWSPPAPDVMRGAIAASRADASSSLRARCSRSRSSCSSKNSSRSSWVKAGLSIFMAPPMYPAKSEPAARFRGDPGLLENRLMCYTDDARPPLPPISGAAADMGDLELTASDGNKFAAYFARAEKPTGAGMVVLPDVRGLHEFYKELAQRFAEAGGDAVAIDYFCRTAGIGGRGERFCHISHREHATQGNNAHYRSCGVSYLDQDHGGA